MTVGRAPDGTPAPAEWQRAACASAVESGRLDLPLAGIGGHPAALADLTVYLRQHHAERDLARLGELGRARGRVVIEPARRPHPIDAPGTDERAGAAWPWLSALPGGRRTAETAAALRALGDGAAEVVRLRLPDSGLATREEELTAALAPLVAPREHDLRPDHEAAGRAVAHFTRPVEVLFR